MTRMSLLIGAFWLSEVMIGYFNNCEAALEPDDRVRASCEATERREYVGRRMPTYKTGVPERTPYLPSSLYFHSNLPFAQPPCNPEYSISMAFNRLASSSMLSIIATAMALVSLTQLNIPEAIAQIVLAPLACARNYTVQPGDWCDKISAVQNAST